MADSCSTNRDAVLSCIRTFESSQSRGLKPTGPQAKACGSVKNVPLVRFGSATGCPLLSFDQLFNGLKKTVVESVVCFFLGGVMERLTKTDLHGM